METAAKRVRVSTADALQQTLTETHAAPELAARIVALGLWSHAELVLAMHAFAVCLLAIPVAVAVTVEHYTVWVPGQQHVTLAPDLADAATMALRWPTLMATGDEPFWTHLEAYSTALMAAAWRAAGQPGPSGQWRTAATLCDMHARRAMAVRLADGAARLPAEPARDAVVAAHAQRMVTVCAGDISRETRDRMKRLLTLPGALYAYKLRRREDARVLRVEHVRYTDTDDLMRTALGLEYVHARYPERLVQDGGAVAWGGHVRALLEPFLFAEVMQTRVSDRVRDCVVFYSDADPPRLADVLDLASRRPVFVAVSRMYFVRWKAHAYASASPGAALRRYAELYAESLGRSVDEGLWDTPSMVQ